MVDYHAPAPPSRSGRGDQVPQEQVSLQMCQTIRVEWDELSVNVPFARNPNNRMCVNDNNNNSNSLSLSLLAAAL